jgi:hypothetical protein
MIDKMNAQLDPVDWGNESLFSEGLLSLFQPDDDNPLGLSGPETGETQTTEFESASGKKPPAPGPNLEYQDGCFTSVAYRGRFFERNPRNLPANQPPKQKRKVVPTGGEPIVG